MKLILNVLHKTIQSAGYRAKSFHGSFAQREIFDFVCSLGFNAEENNRQVLNGKEIDIWIPERNIGIELDGLFWHKEHESNDRLHSIKKKKC